MRKMKILVIDDDEMFCELFKVRLEAEGIGYVIASQHDPVAALKFAHDWQPQVILVDLDMPRISGFGVVQLIKQDTRLRRCKIYIVTSLFEKGLRDHALEIGATAYVGKDCLDAELLPGLERLSQEVAQAE